MVVKVVAVAAFDIVIVALAGLKAVMVVPAGIPAPVRACPTIGAEVFDTLIS